MRRHFAPLVTTGARLLRTAPRMLVLTLALAVGLGAGACGSDSKARLEGKKALKAAELARLKRDITKIDKSIRVTKELIAVSKGERYLPDLYFRLAELHIEKSRLVYFRILEEAGAEDKTAVVAPEARLLKDQAIAIYKRILADFPEYPDNDKIRFFIAHEYRELGKFDEMIKTYRELVEKHDKSNFRFEAWLILGDYHFDKGEVDEGLQNYQQILNNPETYAHNMARYKAGWCWINKDKPANAVDLWEKAITTETPLEPGEVRGPDDEPRLGVRREALKDLAFYYAESREPTTALPFFEQLTRSRQEHQIVLEKLAKRFQIKTLYNQAANVYRELIGISGDIDKNIEWAQAVYDAAVAARNLKSADDDVVMLSEVSARYKYWWRATEEEKLVIKDFELLARDLATRLQTLAKEKKDDKLYARAARAYKSYLSVFKDSPARLEMEWNYAESLFQSNQYVRAGQQYEKVLKFVGQGQVRGGKPEPVDDKKGDGNDAAKPDDKDPKAAKKDDGKGKKKKPSKGDVENEEKQAMYSAILSYFEALKAEEKGTRFESMMAREGIKHLGSRFVSKYPADKNTPNVKFNIARANYEQGKFDTSIELFTAFVNEYPDNKEAPIAAELALDAFAQKEDFQGLANAAREFAKNKRLADDAFRQRFLKMADQAEQEEINRRTIEAEGKVQEALATFIVEKKGTELAARALHQAFVIARDRRNFGDMLKSGRPLLEEYAETKYALEVLPSLAEQAVRLSQMEQAANFYEEYARRYPKGENADDFLEGAANIRMELGEFDAAMADYERLARQGSEERKPGYYARLAETAAQAGAWRRASQATQPILEHPAHGVLAGAIAGEAAFRAGDLENAQNILLDTVTLAGAGEGLEDGPMWLGRAQYLLGEIARQQFEGITYGTADPGEVLAAKFEGLSILEGAYVGAIQAGDPEYAMGGLYRIAAAYRDTAEFLDKAPVPDGLSPEEEAQYKAALAERSGPLREQADVALGACREKALELQAFNRFVKACVAGQAVDDDGDRLRPRPRGVAIPGRESIEKKLVDDPKNLKLLTELVRAANSVRDYHLARLIAQRALELDERNAEMQNLLGLATAGTNRMQEAANAFKKAIKIQNRHPEANANLGTLFAMFGDTDRANRAFAKVEGLSLNMTDVLPQYSEYKGNASAPSDGEGGGTR